LGLPVFAVGGENFTVLDGDVPVGILFLQPAVVLAYPFVVCAAGHIRYLSYIVGLGLNRYRRRASSDLQVCEFVEKNPECQRRSDHYTSD